jgi:nitrogen fixation protein FixH
MSGFILSFSKCRWVPWAIVGAFVIIATVNGALAYFALHSDTGLVAQHPFELGNGYNRVLDDGAAQDALGWRGTAMFSPDRGRLDGRIIVQLRDGHGAPLDDLAVKVAIVRPIEPLPEQDLALLGAGSGVYEAPIVLARGGQWELRVSAARGGQIYQFAKRVVAP